MYENEYGKINNTEQQNPYINPPAGGYTDYTGYRPESDMVNTTPPKKGHGKVITACIALTLAGLLIGSGVSYAYLSARNNSGKADSKTAQETETHSFSAKENHVELTKTDNNEESRLESILPTTAGSDTMTPAQIAEKCLSSVVAITNYGETEIRSMWGNFTQETKGAGSGVIIGESDDELLILTNYHVVENSKSLSVIFSWEEDSEEIDKDHILYATIKDYDEGHDIAVISINIDDLSSEVLDRIAIATVGSSDDLKLGEQVVAIGNALGYGQSVTTGIVSALNRQLNDPTSDIGNENKYIQTDAAINLGNSGGALFNMHGELVGINTAMMRSDVAENMGLAIPISDVSDEIEGMMNQETREKVSEDERGYLGINIVDVTEDISNTYGIPQGVYVSNVSRGSGADKAGIEKEDIIVAVNGRSTLTSNELTGYLSKYKAGETVTVTVKSHSGDEYVTKDVDVVLGNSSTFDEEYGSSGEQEPEREEDQGNVFSFEIPLPFGN